MPPQLTGSFLGYSRPDRLAQDAGPVRTNELSNVAYCPLADLPICASNVRLRGGSDEAMPEVARLIYEDTPSFGGQAQASAWVTQRGSAFSDAGANRFVDAAS
jgi:hypothetical protein